MTEMGSAEVDSRLEEQLIDGILYAFQAGFRNMKVSRFDSNLNLF